MRELETWIENAAVAMALTLERLPEGDAKSIVDMVEAQFVRDSPRIWSLGIKTPYAYYDSESTNLLDILPPTAGKVFFIPEADDGDLLPVYLVNPSQLETLIGECPFFEYYVVAINKEWLVAETEHNVFIVCLTSEAKIRLKPGSKLWV